MLYNRRYHIVSLCGRIILGRSARLLVTRFIFVARRRRCSFLNVLMFRLMIVTVRILYRLLATILVIRVSYHLNILILLCLILASLFLMRARLVSI